MKLKLTISLIIFALVFGTSTLLMAQGSTQGGAVKSDTAAVSQPTAPKGQAALQKSDARAAVPQLSHKVIAYYFYGKVRCPSCKKIEAYSQEAIQGQGGFAGPLKDGRLEWRAINVEEPGNEHFTKDFQIYTKSLVIVDTIDGKQKQWKNLAKVWELLYDKDGFVKYVRDEINSYLGGKS